MPLSLLVWNPPVLAIVNILSCWEELGCCSKLLSSFAKTIMLTLFPPFDWSFKLLATFDFTPFDFLGELELVFGVVPRVL